MRRFLLDTNTVSQLLRKHPGVTQRIQSVPMANLRLSVITEAELRFGLARRPEAHRLRQTVDALLQRIDVLPWDRACAGCYGLLRAELTARGTPIAPLDLLIATQAITADFTLVSNDQAFRHIPNLPLEDWTI